MKMNLRSLLMTAFWFSIGLTVAIFALQTKTIDLNFLSLTADPKKVNYQHRLTIPARVVSENTVSPI